MSNDTLIKVTLINYLAGISVINILLFFVKKQIKEGFWGLINRDWHSVISLVVVRGRQLFKLIVEVWLRILFELVKMIANGLVIIKSKLFNFVERFLLMRYKLVLIGALSIIVLANIYSRTKTIRMQSTNPVVNELQHLNYWPQSANSYFLVAKRLYDVGYEDLAIKYYYLGSNQRHTLMLLPMLKNTQLRREREVRNYVFRKKLIQSRLLDIEQKLDKRKFSLYLLYKKAFFEAMLKKDSVKETVAKILWINPLADVSWLEQEV